MKDVEFEPQEWMLICVTIELHVPQTTNDPP